MSRYVTCPDCNGRKVMQWLGGIDKDCHGCFGVGYIDSEAKNAVEERKEQEGGLGEHKRTRRGRTSAKSSDSDSVVECG